MTTLKHILDALEPQAESGAEGAAWRGTVPENWLQGRTAYGGLSSAIALHCAMRSDVDLPPLRSAQISFIGPLAGAITITTQRLRRGKNAAFIQADVTGDAGLGLRCTFVFMRAIASELDHRTTTRPDFPCPRPGDRTYNGNAQVAFSRNFEFLDQRDPAALKPAEWLRWTRLSDRDGLDPMVELLAVGDGLPPAALRLLGRVAPVSSMTWMLNVLGPAPVTRDGWWLLQADSDYAHAGSSSQRMGIWNADGEMVAEQMQSVAVFA